MIRLDFPPPPSTNALHICVPGSGGRMRRVRSKEYEAWRTPNVQLLRIKRLRVKAYPVRILITVVGGLVVNEARDLDNFAKALIDALKSGGVIADDNLRHVHELTVRYRPRDRAAPTPGRVEVVVYEPGEADPVA